MATSIKRALSWCGCARPRISRPDRQALKEEVKTSMKIVWPTVISNILGLGLTLLNISFVGRLGKTELAAAALASMTINCCWSGAVGLLCAIDTLGSQAYGAGNPKRVGVILQRALWIITLYFVPVGLFFWFSEPVLKALGQTAEVAHMAAKYCRIVIPGMPFIFYREAFMRTFISVGIAVPQMIVGAINIALAAGLNYLFIFGLNMRLTGAAISLLAVYVISFPVLLVVAWLFGVFKKIWGGWTREAFREWGQYLWLALPGIVMVCAEWMAFEICAIFAGIISEQALAAFSICYNTSSLLFMIPLTFAVVGSSRIGNNLGSGNPGMARFLSYGIMLLQLVSSVVYIGVFLAIRRVWGRVFTNEPSVLEEVTSALRFSLTVAFFDGVQGAASGILRGCGQQLFGGVCNAVFYYAVSVPMVAVIIFRVRKTLPALFLAFASGVALQGVTFLVRVTFFDYEKVSEKVVAREKANIAAAKTTGGFTEVPNATADEQTVPGEEQHTSAGEAVVSGPAGDHQSPACTDDAATTEGVALVPLADRRAVTVASTTSVVDEEIVSHQEP